MVTFTSDAERLALFLGDDRRAATYMAAEDSAFRGIIRFTRWFTWAYNKDSSFPGVIAKLRTA